MKKNLIYSGIKLNRAPVALYHYNLVWAPENFGDSRPAGY